MIKETKKALKKYKSLKTDKLKAKYIIDIMKAIDIGEDFGPLMCILKDANKTLTWGWYDDIVTITDSVFKLCKPFLQVEKERAENGNWYYSYELKDSLCKYYYFSHKLVNTTTIRSVAQHQLFLSSATD